MPASCSRPGHLQCPPSAPINPTQPPCLSCRSCTHRQRSSLGRLLRRPGARLPDDLPVLRQLRVQLPNLLFKPAWAITGQQASASARALCSQSVPNCQRGGLFGQHWYHAVPAVFLAQLVPASDCLRHHTAGRRHSRVAPRVELVGGLVQGRRRLLGLPRAENALHPGRRCCCCCCSMCWPGCCSRGCQ